MLLKQAKKKAGQMSGQSLKVFRDQSQSDKTSRGEHSRNAMGGDVLLRWAGYAFFLGIKQSNFKQASHAQYA